MLCMVPITNAPLGTLPPQRLKNASGLFNLMRNLGGAVGLALINTIMNDRMDLHLERLRESVAWGRSAATDTLASMTQAMNSLGSNADLGSIAQLARIVRREGDVIAIGRGCPRLHVLFRSASLLSPL